MNKEQGAPALRRVVPAPSIMAKRSPTQGAVVREMPSRMRRQSLSPSAMAPRQEASGSSVSWEERQRMIAEAAYYKAEHRGFQGGDPQRDWCEAEAEVDARLMTSRKK